MTKKAYFDPFLEEYSTYDSVSKEARTFKETSKEIASTPLPTKVKMDLANNYNLQKVLVGSYGDQPFYAHIDQKAGVCLPMFEKDL